MIRNYGLLWQRKYLHLGAGSNKGTLLGARSGKGIIDFRDQIGIYVLYDKDHIPVYVGQAGNGNATLFGRLKHHTRDHLWNRWDYFSWFGLRRVNPGSGSLSEHDHAEKVYKSEGSLVLGELEGVLIAAMEPKLNKQGARFTEAEQYFQEVDENITELSLEDVLEQIATLQGEIQKLQKQVGKICA